MLASSFNTNVLRVFSETFVEQALVFIDKLEHMVEGEVDLFHHLSTCTLDIIYGKMKQLFNLNLFRNFTCHTFFIVQMHTLLYKIINNIYFTKYILLSIYY